VRPKPPGGRIPIAVAARGGRLLELVARHADVWDINLPPIPSRVAAAEARLARACRAQGRDPAEIARSMWIFTRVDPDADPAAVLAEFRRLNPWFASIPDDEVAQAWIAGDAGSCRERLAQLSDALRLELPILDLSGLGAAASERALAALAPAELPAELPR
jgi:alkanesulfonate monooxygenase SsuD/methylene tetrahydromethanopterin reductase-like flavin-dependent oxidoreductase (luciferase family)